MVIYLDNNATTKPFSKVVQLVSSLSSTQFGNPSSSHMLGSSAHKHLDTYRKEIGAHLGIADPSHQLVFTSGATESNNIALRGRVARTINKKKPHVICSSIEHASVYVTLHDMADHGLCSLTLVAVDRFGLVDLAALDKAIRPGETVMVAIILGHNVIGTIQDSKSIMRICRKYKGVHVHLDVTQMVGRYPLNFAEIGMDSASFSAHKFHGPRGVGALHLKNPDSIDTVMTGGLQENNMRAGTENLPGIGGMALALRESLVNINDKMARVERMRDDLQAMLVAAFKDKKIIVNGIPPPIKGRPSFCRRLYNTLSISCPFCDSRTVVNELKRRAVCMGVGSACSKSNGSKTLAAIGLSEAQQKGTFRISLSCQTTLRECRDAFNVIHQLLAHTAAPAA